MSDSPNLARDVANDVVDEIDVGSVVTGDGDVADELDGESLGRSVGETLGEALGRLVGGNVVRWLLSKLSFWNDDDPSLAARFGKSLLVAVGRTLAKPEFKEPIGDALRGFVDRLEEKQQAAADAASEASDEATDAAADAADAASDAAEDASDAVSENASEAAEALESTEMDELRKETYRDLLEMMDYSKLQSIAKESGVKANLSRDEMIDAIVEEFDAEAEANETADDGEESANGDEESDDSDDGA
ncbi:hypothetical protein [Halogeometricum limi]|uniref:Uncharacterized protein n=1 Tax=Halogeometricum limi TaxID=555875 RepID=A0A1I6H5Q1_9EURY|nr:hypothetical protein [Halogeometricum limi]SFR49710.1 hypothetical protein SAMN04488124_1798 [Halogeometricum limi]